MLGKMCFSSNKLSSTLETITIIKVKWKIMAISSLVENGRWTPGIGDPTITGWVTVAVYFVVAVICLKAAFSTNTEKLTKNFWLFLTLFLMALGINKQLDLQILLTQLGKDIAIEQGWYKYRRIVQAGFIILIGVIGLTTLTLLKKTYQNTNSSFKVALTGCSILFLFIFTRASSFHHTDIFKSLNLADIKIYSVLELGGLLVIGLGGYQYIKLKKLS